MVITYKIWSLLTENMQIWSSGNMFVPRLILIAEIVWTLGHKRRW